MIDMFSLPYPYAETPEARNESRTAYIRQNLGNMIGVLEAQLEHLRSLRQSFEDSQWRDAAPHGYQRAEWVGRHLDYATGHSRRRFDDAVLVVAVVAGGYENEVSA